MDASYPAKIDVETSLQLFQAVSVFHFSHFYFKPVAHNEIKLK